MDIWRIAILYFSFQKVLCLHFPLFKFNTLFIFGWLIWFYFAVAIWVVGTDSRFMTQKLQMPPNTVSIACQTREWNLEDLQTWKSGLPTIVILECNGNTDDLHSYLDYEADSQRQDLECSCIIQDKVVVNMICARGYKTLKDFALRKKYQT